MYSLQAKRSENIAYQKIVVNPNMTWLLEMFMSTDQWCCLKCQVQGSLACDTGQALLESLASIGFRLPIQSHSHPHLLWDLPSLFSCLLRLLCCFSACCPTPFGPFECPRMPLAIINFVYPPFSKCTDYVLEFLLWRSEGGGGGMHSQLLKNEGGVERIWMEGLCILVGN